MARAVYHVLASSAHCVCLLDDPLSAVGESLDILVLLFLCSTLVHSRLRDLLPLSQYRLGSVHFTFFADWLVVGL